MTAVMVEASALAGGIDILINNAGLHSAEYGPLILSLGLAKVKRLLEVNVIGVLTCWLHTRS